MLNSGSSQTLYAQLFLLYCGKYLNFLSWQIGMKIHVQTLSKHILSFSTALLRNNLYTIQFTLYTCTVPSFLVNWCYKQLSPQSSFRLCIQFLFPLPSWATTNIFSVSWALPFPGNFRLQRVTVCGLCVQLCSFRRMFLRFIRCCTIQFLLRNILCSCQKEVLWASENDFHWDGP